MKNQTIEIEREREREYHSELGHAHVEAVEQNSK